MTVARISRIDECYNRLMVWPTAVSRNLLYVGFLSPWQTSSMRMNALRALGFQVTGIDMSIGGRPGPRLTENPLLYASFRVKFPMDPNGVNQHLAKGHFQDLGILWLDRTVAIRPNTLRSFRINNPRTLIIGFSADDMMLKNNLTHYYHPQLRLYDLMITTKSFHVAELTQVCCPRVVFIDNGFDPDTHCPPTLPISGPMIDVGFIGTYEKERAEDIVKLAQLGIPVTVHGHAWRSRKLHRTTNLTIYPPTEGTSYAETIYRTRINLGFLRRISRDVQTTRSVEIPACGGFMLTERTQEQEAMFTEGVDVEFFSGFDEMLKKVRYYLAHEDERAKIARAGLRRCVESDYTWASRLQGALTEAGLDVR